MTSSVLALLLLAALPPSFLEEEVLEARKVDGPLPTAPADPAWAQAPTKALLAHPQRTVRLFDRKANQALETARPVPLRVKALYGEREVALRLEWPDTTQSLFTPKETASFGDAAAVQLPLHFGAGHRLPHLGMGDEKEWVYLYFARAAEGGVMPGEFVSAGFGSRTRVERPHGQLAMAYDRASHTWRAVLKRPLVASEHSLAAGLVPVAFALWDGERSERGGNKALTGWKFLRLGAYPLDEAFAAKVSWGFGPGELGDAAQGKVLVEAVCSSCHRVGERQFAPAGVAPDLSTLGAIASPAYLKESVLAPSEVMVHGLNPNAHYDKGKPADRFGAYPNHESYRWEMTDPKGARVSRMPPFAQLPEKDVANMVAYLRSLGR